MKDLSGKVFSLSDTKLSVFKRCPRMYQLKYEEKLKEPTSVQLSFGKAFHKAIELYWAGLLSEKNESMAIAEAIRSISSYVSIVDPETLSMIRCLVASYIDFYKNDMKFKVLSVEREVSIDLGGGDLFNGRIDSLVQDLETGDKYVLDTKTAQGDIGVNSIFYIKKKIADQLRFYASALKSEGVVGVIVDSVRKPKIEMFQAVPNEKIKRNKDGSPRKGQRIKSESVQEFETRLIRYIQDNLGNIFIRHKVTYFDDELEESIRNLKSYCKLIKITDELNIHPKNDLSCFAYGRPCSFTDICSGVSSIDDYRRRSI